MSEDIAKRLAKFAVETKYPDIPDDVLEFTKGLALKTVSGMVKGSSMPPSRKIATIMRDLNWKDDAGVIGCGFKTGILEAVFLNAFFAHNSELEDDSFEGGVSWDITVIPLLFPLAQKLRISGKAMLEALAVGLEVHSRTCLFTADHRGVVVVPGAIGPAAAAARAMGLTVEQTAYALGCAMSAVPVSVANFGTDAHYFESALQSFQGIMSAQMAEKGMTSNPDIGSYLSALLGEDKVSPDRMVADLGEKWALRNIWIKKYPCCFLMHRHIDLLLEMRRKNNISYDDVVKIEVPISPADEPCNRPELKTIGDLQFSYQHILGAALYDGDVNFSHIDSDILANPKYQETRSKIDVISNPDWSDLIMVAPGRLTIKMKDGTEFSGERQYPIGAPQEPLAMDQFGQLYSKFTKGILSEEQTKETAEAVLNLEKLNDIEKLMDVLTFR